MESKKRFVTVVIDGLISAGKTTIINDVLVPRLAEKGLSITVVKEPIVKWQEDGIFDLYCEDPSRWSYHFQTKAFHDRVRSMQEQYKKHGNSTDVFLLERSHFSDSLFMHTLHKRKVITDLELKHYNEWWNLWTEVIPITPDVFIYLKPDINVVMERLKKRSRPGETTVDISYQLDLQDAHEKFLGGTVAEIDDSHFVPVFHLNTNADFKNDKEVQRIITEKVESLILKLLETKRLRR